MSGFDLTAREAKRIIVSLLDCEKPIIAKLNGHATGFGATLALFCDIIIATETAKIGDPHVQVGFTAGDGGAVIWPQLIGYARAKEYLMTGDLMTAAEAARIGLINHAVPGDELDDRVYGLAARLAAGSQVAIRTTKMSVNIGLKQLVASIMDACLAYEALSNSSSRSSGGGFSFSREAEARVSGRKRERTAFDPDQLLPSKACFGNGSAGPEARLSAAAWGHLGPQELVGFGGQASDR